jgi:hypothetical protein
VRTVQPILWAVVSWAMLCLQIRHRLEFRSLMRAAAKAKAIIMARKLKTFTTSIGFFDLAIAAPSMKAALEAWGSKQNLFQRGFAKETDDPATDQTSDVLPG